MNQAFSTQADASGTQASASVALNNPPAISRRVWLTVGALTLLGLALPIYAIWSRTYVPLHHLPNHLARHYLEYRWLSGRGLPPFYEIRYHVVPDLGGDLTAPLFFFFFEPMTAVKAFLTACVLLYWIGPTLFIWQHGGRTLAALAAALFWLPWLLCTQFFVGVPTNYSGTGLAFAALAHYSALRSRPSVSIGQIVLHGALVTLLFLWHLCPWGVYCLMAGCGCLARFADDYRRQRGLGHCLARAMPAVLPIVPSVFLLAWYALSHVGGNEPVIFKLGTWGAKAAFMNALFGDYSRPVTAIVLLLWAAGIVSTFGFGVLFTGHFRKNWLHLSIAALLLAYLIVPQDFLSVGTDYRLLSSILVVLLAALAELPVRRIALAAVLLAACIVLRDGAVVRAWDRISARLDSYAPAFALIEPGSRVMPVTPSLIDYTLPDMAFYEWAAVLRDAFVPTLFHRDDSHTLRLLPQSKVYVERTADRYEIDKAKVEASYDYVWLYNPEHKVVEFPRTWQRVFAANPMELWRVRSSAGNGSAESSNSLPHP